MAQGFEVLSEAELADTLFSPDAGTIVFGHIARDATDEDPFSEAASSTAPARTEPRRRGIPSLTSWNSQPAPVLGCPQSSTSNDTSKVQASSLLSTHQHRTLT